MKTDKKVFLYVCLFCLIALSFGFAVLINRFANRREPVPVPLKTVTVREGLTAVEISKLLQSEGIFVHNEVLPSELEGYLFPDTYEFYVPSSLDFAVKKMSDNFNKRVLPAVPDKADLKEIITVASLVEDEAKDSYDRRLVAGIILKRLKSGMFLQVDSTICYIKVSVCHPIKKQDLAADSPYNTYLYKGLPPGPISNPGLDSISAAINPIKSDYWFYISNPATGRMVFAKTLEEHDQNIARYLY